MIWESIETALRDAHLTSVTIPLPEELDLFEYGLAIQRLRRSFPFVRKVTLTHTEQGRTLILSWDPPEEKPSDVT